MMINIITNFNKEVILKDHLLWKTFNRKNKNNKNRWGIKFQVNSKLIMIGKIAFRIGDS